jgi:glycosyltransferase involved in cell wall biosynthesis
MIIVTTLYNGADYIAKCITSIKSQTFKDFTCYITDDMSTDNSVELTKTLIEGDDRFILIENKTKHYQGGNYDQVIRDNPNIDDNEVIVELDGDDWFPDVDTLQRIADVYSDNDVWIANGSFVYSSGAMGFARKQVINNIRKSTFTASHIRTWRAFLWRAIKIEDLKDVNGEWWTAACDLAFMFSMLEMAGDEHYRFMTEINYVYNETNPLNEHKVIMSSVNQVVSTIRSKPPYKRLVK